MLALEEFMVQWGGRLNNDYALCGSHPDGGQWMPREQRKNTHHVFAESKSASLPGGEDI